MCWWVNLRADPARTYGADMRVKVSPTGLYTYPDLVVVCGRPRFEDKEWTPCCNPTVIVEILSKSTEAYDLGREVCPVPHVGDNDYLLISQDKPHIEHFTRAGGVSFPRAPGRYAVSADRVHR